MHDAVSVHDLEQAAYHGERTASRRLARTLGLTDMEALRRTLETSAGAAGLPALLEQRALLRTRDAVRAAARQADRASTKAARDSRHAGRPAAWRAWFDGSARPNPGRCGIGALLTGPGGIRIEIARDVGYGNSSEAEYAALVALLEAALAHGAADIAIHGDSRVVIDDVAAPVTQAAPALADWRARAHTLLAQLPQATLHWVPRHRNTDADALSQRALATPSLLEPHAD